MAGSQGPTASRQHNLTLHQDTSFVDQSLTNGNLYHIELTFTIQAGLV
jgi:hypothetical protein